LAGIVPQLHDGVAPRFAVRGYAPPRRNAIAHAGEVPGQNGPARRDRFGHNARAALPCLGRYTQHMMLCKHAVSGAKWDCAHKSHVGRAPVGKAALWPIPGNGEQYIVQTRDGVYEHVQPLDRQQSTQKQQPQWAR
jgi:hypothetical protein